MNGIERLFRVCGCDVTIICPAANVQGWVRYIIDHGGVPTVKPYKEEVQ